MFVFLAIGILFLGAVLWLLLERHEKRRAANGKSRHSRPRPIIGGPLFLSGFLAWWLAMRRKSR